MDRRPESGRGDGKDSWDSYDTVFLNSKAGMDGVDKKKVQKVVYEMSKGSRYFDNEQRKQAAAEQRVQAMTLQAASLTPAQLAAYEKEADLKIAELEASRDLSRIWLHVDMDAFYAAVETLEDASLASKPMAVGGMSMICTANYEARKFGVRAAMPGFIARKLCPDLVFVRPDFEKYTRYSEMSRQVFRTYDANFVAGSLDEAYLDITNSCRSRNLSAAEVAEELRDGVHKATGLTCSAGVGPNRLLAKVCSDIKKPNGQFVLSNDRAAVMAFISSLPIRKVSGIGKVTEGQLKDVLGISTCADLLTKRSYISALFSRISTDFFLAVALGVGGSEPPKEEPRKSLSNERTFPAISREVDLFSKLEELAHALAEDMQKEDLQGRTLTLKLKSTEFEVRTRAVTLPSFIYLKEDVLLHASKLLKGELPITVRLMGLRMSHFKGEKVESADRTQRTLTSFLPHLPASESCRTEVRQNPSDELDTDDATILSSCEGDFARKSGSSHDDHLRGTSNGEVNGGIAKQDLTKATSELSCYATPTKRHGKDLLLNGQKTMDFILFKQRAGASKSGDCGECLDTRKQGSGSDIPASEPQQLLHQFPGALVAVRSHFRADACQASTSAMADLRGGGILTQDGYSLQEHIWVEDRCSLCGIQVNDCLPSARQEHEDYHFALALQKEGASVSTPFASQSRRNEREAVNKRKLTAMKRQHTPTKEGGHVPIEAFFNRVHSGSSEQTKRSR